MQATVHASNCCVPVAHLIAPVVAFSATIESMWLSGEMHCDSVPPAAWQSFAACGTV